MNFSQFKKSEFKRFCSILNFKPDCISQIAANIDSYYNEWITDKKDNKTNDFKRYKDGTIKQRIIRPPKDELKKIQGRIKDRILAQIELPDCIHGGVKKRSNITNAKPHQGKKYQFTTDLKDFYPSISAKKVYDTFISLKFSTHFAHWLTKLTTWKNSVPQGAPTSTHIANLVFLKADCALICLCNQNNITYTRYIDDLTFSSQQDFSHLISDILQIIMESNFKLSYRKTKYKGNQTITGIDVFLHKIDAPDRIKEKAKIEAETNAVKQPYTGYMNRIRKTNHKADQQPSRTDLPS